MLRRALVGLAVVGVLLGTGCGDDDNEATPTSAAASPTADSTVPPIVDQVTQAVSSGDPAELETLLEYHTEVCTTTPPGGGGPPVCATTEQNGTALEGITRIACENEFIRRGDLNLSSAVATDLTFYGAYSFNSDFPKGAEYIIIFERSTLLGGSIGMGYIVNDSGVIALQYGCGWASIDDFIEGNNLGTPIATPT